MRIQVGKVRIRWKAGKSNDPEKLILPGAVFCGRSDEHARGFLIALGWWDYHLSTIIAWPRDSALREQALSEGND